MKRMLSSSLSHYVFRHLSTTAAATATATAAVTPAAPRCYSTSAKGISGILLMERDPDKALQLFSSITDHLSDPESSRAAFVDTLNLLLKAKRFNDIENVINSYLDVPSIPQPSVAYSLFRFYLKARMFDKALEFYHQLGPFGAYRSFHALIILAFRCKVFDRIPHLFDEMPLRYGFQPHMDTYNYLIKVHCDKGDPELGMKILEEIRFPDENSIYQHKLAVTSALFKKEKSVEAYWFEYKLDLKKVNIRIAAASSPEAAKREVQYMTYCGVYEITPDTSTFHSLLTRYCTSYRVYDALELLSKLEACGFRPTAEIFETLIYYLCRIKDYDKGYDVFKWSMKHKEVSNGATLKDLVEGKAGKKIKDAKGLISTMKTSFPHDESIEWKKVEAKLGFVSDETLAKTGDPEAPQPEPCERMQMLLSYVFR